MLTVIKKRLRNQSAVPTMLAEIDPKFPIFITKTHRLRVSACRAPRLFSHKRIHTDRIVPQLFIKIIRLRGPNPLAHTKKARMRIHESELWLLIKNLGSTPQIDGTYL